MENGTEYLKAGVEPLLQWYETHRRPLPFRDAPTPYRVWISEIMLQQTRIEAVLPRYEAFLRALPTVQALAEVSEEALLKLWEGLGYYSRARYLRQAAQQMMQQYGGELPADFAALRALPGIGDYTAGAIASIAYGIAVPAVDGNVLRVLARLLCYREDVLQGKPRAYLSRVAAALVPEDRPGMFNEAVMELGETVCLPAACAPRGGRAVRRSCRSVSRKPSGGPSGGRCLSLSATSGRPACCCTGGRRRGCWRGCGSCRTLRVRRPRRRCSGNVRCRCSIVRRCPRRGTCFRILPGK